MSAYRTSALSCFAALVLAVPAGLVSAADFAGGTGEPNDPYQIATAEQLASIGFDPNLLGKHFILTADIDLDPNLPGGRVFTDAVIAAYDGSFYDSSPYDGFTGCFDGDGHAVRNLTLHGNQAGCTGLFGYIGLKGRVRNLRLEGVEVWGVSVVGALAGCNGGTIENCNVSGSVSARFNAGGLAGYNWSGAITRCRAAVDVTGTGGGTLGGLVGYNNGTIAGSRATGSVTSSSGSSIGGLVGAMGEFGCFVTSERGLIVNCCATGNVSSGAGSWWLGGLVGSSTEGTIANCYATGPVAAGEGSFLLGGLVGENGAPGGYAAEPGLHMGTIVNCYATGSVTVGGSPGGGGLVGRNFDGTVLNSFWDAETSGLDSSDGGTGLTTDQMRDVRTFVEAGWDWVDEGANGTADLWSLPEDGGYPELTLLFEGYEPRELEGAGTPDDPYKIVTAEDLGAMCHYSPSACYSLAADVNLAEITWSAAPISDFHGVFDGAGFAISGLRIRGGGHLGLFGALGAHAGVTDLGVVDANVVGADHGAYLGLLAGVSRGEIRRCYATGAVGGGDSACFVGGLAGGVSRSAIRECYVVAGVSAKAGAWGLGGSSGQVT